MGIETKASAFSTNVQITTLDAISKYEVTRMCTKLRLLLITDTESVTVCNLDSTSIHVHKSVATEIEYKDKQFNITFIDD